MEPQASLPDAHGHFGPFGGQFVPETLMTALADLVEAYRQAQQDDLFQRQLSALLRDYAGRREGRGEDAGVCHGCEGCVLT